jgi:hypothetical protein
MIFTIDDEGQANEQVNFKMIEIEEEEKKSIMTIALE